MNGMVARVALALTLALCAEQVRAETTDDYIQDGLVACWDGVENAGRLTHESDTTNWVDVVGGRIFRMNKATVRDNAMYFGGAKVSNVYPQGFLNADDTAATFGQIKSGTLEIVLRAEKNAIQTALQASPGMLVHLNSDSATIWTANAWNYFWTGAIFDWYNATNTLSILYHPYSKVPTQAVSDDLYANGEATERTTGKSGVYATANISRLAINHDNNRPFKGSIFCIRLYSKQLSQADIAANRAVDVKRFFEGKTSVADGVTVDGFPFPYQNGDAPAYGRHTEVTAGQTVTFTAPETVPISAGERRFCTGWKLYDASSMALLDESTTATRLTCSFTYQRPVRLVWQWRQQFLASVTTSGGIVATPPLQWIDAGGMATFALSGAPAYTWAGNGITYENVHAPSVTLPVEAALPLTASACPVIHVTEEGAGDKSGADWANACPGFTNAMELVDGVTTPVIVRFAAGTYVTGASRSANYTIATPLQLEGATGDPADVTLDGKGYGFVLNNDFAVLSGLTINNFQAAGTSVSFTITKGMVTNCVARGSASGKNAAASSVTISAGALMTDCALDYLRGVHAGATICALYGGGVLRRTRFTNSYGAYREIYAMKGDGRRARIEDCEFPSSKLPYVVSPYTVGVDAFGCVATNCTGFFAYIQQPCSFTDCLVAGNGGEAQFDIVANGATPVGITNCVVVRNRSMGIRLNVSTALNVSVSHCTIADNETTATKAGGGVYFNTANNRITDSIVHGNLNFGVPADITLAGTAPAPTRCCFGEADEEDGNGNIASDPLFADPAARDYSLLPSSPCIDAGAAVGPPVRDIAGATRPVDGDGDGVAVGDMGAYEAPVCSEALACALELRLASGLAPLDVPLAARVRGSRQTGLTYVWTATRTTPEGQTTTTLETAAPSCIFEDLPVGIYSFSLTVRNDAEDTATDTIANALHVISDHLCVTPTGAGVRDGSDWANALGSIQEAVDIAGTTPATIRLGYGTYVLPAQVSVAADADLVFDGGYAGQGDARADEASVITRDTSVNMRLFEVAGATAAFTNLTLTGGYMAPGGTHYGMGVYGRESHLRFDDCAITNNGGSYSSKTWCYGVGVSVRGGSLAVNGGTLSRNYMSCSKNGDWNDFIWGGGLYANGATVNLSGVELDHNYLYCSQLLSGNGGALYLTGGRASVVDCVFRTNYVQRAATSRGGTIGGTLYATGLSTLAITNCAFTGGFNNSYEGTSTVGKGGFAYFSGASQTVTMKNCVVTDMGWRASQQTYDSGALTLAAGTLVLENVLVNGSRGNAIEVTGGTAAITNATIAGATAISGDVMGYGLRQSAGALTLRNSILWDNALGGASLAGDTADIAYTLSQEELAGTGNFSADPLFADDTYRHLFSRGGYIADGWFGGRWTIERPRPGLRGMSPAIDRGDPHGNYADEPEPHGRRLNLGAYGGTPYASATIRQPSVIVLR
ncbi:MAG: right-handed parallel beta-helix repeat-containing protein [Kiritimatiellae bacterium]|nr:right-handed parallel beta-helix repeat-containing protein [Kiritimatiellia bacterium]